MRKNTSEATQEPLCNQRKITLADIGPDLVSAANAVLLAKTYSEVMRGRVDEIGRAVLAECPLDVADRFREHGRPEKITEPGLVYLCDDDAQLEDYYTEINKRQRAAGLKPETMQDDHCPASVAENVRRDAEHILIECAEPLYGCTVEALLCAAGGLERYRKYVDLLCGLVVRMPGYKNPLTGKDA